MNDPGPVDPEDPDAVLDGWFCRVRPPVSRTRPPRLDAPAAVPVPHAMALAREDGLSIESVRVLCLVTRTVRAVPQGLIECQVVVGGHTHRRSIRLRLTERRAFYHIRLDRTPSPVALATRCILLTTPIGRSYDVL